MKKLFYVLFIVAVTLLGLTFTYKNQGDTLFQDLSPG